MERGLWARGCWERSRGLGYGGNSTPWLEDTSGGRLCIMGMFCRVENLRGVMVKALGWFGAYNRNCGARWGGADVHGRVGGRGLAEED